MGARARRLVPWALAALAFACERPPRPAPREGAPPDIALTNVTLRHYRGSTPSLVASAPHASLARQSADLFAVDAGVWLPASGVALTARAVTGNLGALAVEGRGGVTLTSRDGVVGRSPRVLYERNLGAQGGASSDAGLSVDHPRFSLEADGFALDFAEQRATFDRPKTVAKAAPAP